MPVHVFSSMDSRRSKKPGAKEKLKLLPVAHCAQHTELSLPEEKLKILLKQVMCANYHSKSKK